MKALTLWQPWASLVAEGVKTIETRSWKTSYRGPLAIHASVMGAAWAFPGSDVAWEALAEVYGLRDGYELWHECAAGEGYQQGYITPPFGSVLATCELLDVVPTEGFCFSIDDPQPGYGDFTPGRYAWLLGEITRLPEPVPARGKQGLWEWAP